MSAGITLDSSEWREAMAWYAAAGKKTAATSANHAIAEIMYQAAKVTKAAEEAQIRALEKSEMWPKLVATLLTNSRHKQAEVLAATPAFAGGVGYMRGSKLLDAALRKHKARARKIAKLQHYTREQAQAFSKKLIEKRVRGIRFLRFFFVSGSLIFSKFAKGQKAAFDKKFSGFDPLAIPATEGNTNASLEVNYIYAFRTEDTALRAEERLQQSLDAGVDAALDSIKSYVKTKMGADAAAISAVVA